MPDTIAIDFSQPIPLFPLPRCVLLPHGTLPLHIFEPRYKAMVDDALRGRKLIAMASCTNLAWQQASAGHPTLRRHVCVGFILRHQRLDDGCFNILLQGTCRARIVRELPSDLLYRTAILRPTEQHGVLEIDLSEERQRLEDLLCDPMLRELASISAIHNWLSAEIPTAVLVDLAIMTICENEQNRYTMLEESDIRARAEFLELELHQMQSALKTAQRFGNGQSPEGWQLN